FWDIFSTGILGHYHIWFIKRIHFATQHIDKVPWLWHNIEDLSKNKGGYNENSIKGRIRHRK
ncbi:MAG: hypothetical protein RR626_06095, partial [Anaerovoracaceae bacterium]